MSLSNQYWIRTILTVVPPYFADYLRIQPHSVCVFTDLCTITCARRHSLLSKTLIILIVYHFGVQLQDVFILHSFMRLSSTGSFLYVSLRLTCFSHCCMSNIKMLSIIKAEKIFVNNNNVAYSARLSNSSTISCDGGAVSRLTTTMATAEQMNAGSSS